MQIDPTKWPKVTGKAFEADGLYWHVYSDGSVACYKHMTGHRVDRGNAELSATHYGPIEFPPPKVIPPKPSLELRLIETRHGDKWCLDWCDVWLPVGELDKVRVMSYYKDECKDITPND